jgi:hypothetical protein
MQLEMAVLTDAVFTTAQQFLHFEAEIVGTVPDISDLLTFPLFAGFPLVALVYGFGHSVGDIPPS